MRMQHPRWWALVGLSLFATSSACGALGYGEGGISLDEVYVAHGGQERDNSADAGGRTSVHADDDDNDHDGDDNGGNGHDGEDGNSGGSGDDGDGHQHGERGPWKDWFDGHSFFCDDAGIHTTRDGGTRPDAGSSGGTSSSSGSTSGGTLDAGVSSSSGGYASSSSSEMTPGSTSSETSSSSTSTDTTPDAGETPFIPPTCGNGLIPFVVNGPANGSYSDGWLTVWLNGTSLYAGSWNTNVGINQLIVESAHGANVDFMYEVSSGIYAAPMNATTDMMEPVTRLTFCYDREPPVDTTSSSSSSSSSGGAGSVDAGAPDCTGLQALASWEFRVTRGGNTFSVPHLRGSVEQGDHVTVQFSVVNGCSVDLVLASYKAPNAGPNTELQQTLFDHQQGSFSSGGTLEVDIPGCFFQVDFALGGVITNPLLEGSYGPRLIDADNGGTMSCDVSTSSSTMQSSSSSAMQPSSSYAASSSSSTMGSSSSGPAPCTGNGRIGSYRFEITRNGQTFTVTDLRNRTRSGDHIKAIFTVVDGCKEVSLVAYIAPSPCFQSEEAHLQRIVDYDTGTYPPGTHEQHVTLPACFYQVDFVKGPPIEILDVEGFYSSQNRLISADNGGTGRCHDIPELSVRSGNQQCPNGKTAFRIDAPANGTFTNNTLSVTLTNVTSTSFKWSSNLGVDRVMVKGGNKTQVYVKDDMTGGVGMSPKNGNNRPDMSKIIFCY